MDLNIDKIQIMVDTHKEFEVVWHLAVMYNFGHAEKRHFMHKGEFYYNYVTFDNKSKRINAFNLLTTGHKIVNLIQLIQWLEHNKKPESVLMPFKIAKEEVRVYKNHLTVGCQGISYDKVKSIWDMFELLRESN
jgi:hypothetical protein